MGPPQVSIACALDRGENVRLMDADLWSRVESILALNKSPDGAPESITAMFSVSVDEW